MYLADQYHHKGCFLKRLLQGAVELKALLEGAVHQLGSNEYSAACLVDLRFENAGVLVRTGFHDGSVPSAQDSFELLIAARKDRTSAVSGKSVSVRVDLGGRRILKNKK